MKRFVQNLKKKLLTFLQVQCFLSLVSLPVIVAWGLPFSLMTAVGNFIFSPFITIFLLCSSLIFFTELLSIPNQYLIIILEWITKIWLICLSYGSKSWLVGLPTSLLPLLCIIAILTFITFKNKKLNYPLHSIVIAGIFIIRAYPKIK